MHKELKKAIVVYILNNDKEFQLHNAVSTEFKQYIYTPNGEYCFGGSDVKEFIDKAINLLTKN